MISRRLFLYGALVIAVVSIVHMTLKQSMEHTPAPETVQQSPSGLGDTRNNTISDSLYFKESEYVTKKVLAEETPEYKISYEYPQLQRLANKEARDSLNASFVPDSAEIKEPFTESRMGQSIELFQAFNDTTYDVGYLSPELLSLKITKSEYLGYEAHDHQNASTATYDLATGKQLTLYDLVSTNHMDTLVKLVSDDLNSRGQGFPNFHHPEALTAGELDKFVLTKKGIVFVFDPYEVASFSEGFIEVIIPYDTIEGMLSTHSAIKGILVE